ncbi:GvpL/GvpF family gas vesicle protein [Streptomyces albus subsp. chlorinus]|uniref:GvpL/GvpF family gas vesicle protein n=1 Tax=Streptomyces albus TaxID=1888 RepID=UPI00156F599F|nr:GvpL/GvpF family gas vesicle protein [Streptomyces albus]NSC20812.1 GvpL/GvpF family gas vesicle protein [Streptomyces albus subsp. chlorinus]
MTGELRYVYAVTAPLHASLPADLRGVAGSVPYLVEHAGLAAVAGRVPEADFAEEPLRAHLEDLGWLEETARAHQRVVDALTARTCPLPLRLATVYRDDDGVRRALEEGAEEFHATLRRLAGRVEWGVKVYAQRAPEPAAAPRAAPASGREFLRRRRQEVTARENVLEEAEELGRTLHAALAAEAEEVRTYPAQNPQLSKVPGQNLLNAAYLVPRERSDAFVARVEQLGGHDPAVRVELTGPWAPYSFATSDTGTTGTGTTDTGSTGTETTGTKTTDTQERVHDGAGA